MQRARPWLQSVPEAAFTQHAGWLQNAIACYQERVALLSEFAGKIGWLFADPAMDEAASKSLAKEPAAGQWLRDYANVLERARA